MKKNNDYKIYIVTIYTVILYAVLISLQNIPIELYNLNKNVDLKIYYIIYQVFAFSSSLLYFLIWNKKTDKEIKEQSKKYIIGISSIITYFLLSQLQLLPFQLLNIDTSKISKAIKIIYSICYEGIIIGIIILINSKKLKKDLKDLKKNHKEYYKNNLKYWLMALFVMYVSNLILTIMSNGGIPNNEEIIREQFQVSPLYIFISAVCFAPILEELVFRQSIRNLINNKWLFIILSGLIFGGMHVFTNDINSIIDILYIIPYSAPGVAFAYMLYKTDNIFVSTGFHLLHNGILLSLQFFVMLF